MLVFLRTFLAPIMLHWNLVTHCLNTALCFMCYLPLGGAAEMVNKGPNDKSLNIFSFLTTVEFLLYIHCISQTVEMLFVREHTLKPRIRNQRFYCKYCIIHKINKFNLINKIICSYDKKKSKSWKQSIEGLSSLHP